MEIRTDTETLEQLATLVSFLSSRRQGILHAWRSAVLEDPDLKTASKVSVLHFEDSIPRMLESFEQMLAIASDRSRSRKDEEKAHEHGAHRWLEGYSLRELVQEWGHLQVCVMDELDQYAEARYDQLFPKVLRFGRRLWLKLSGEAISDSIEQFTRLQQAEAEAVFQDLQQAVTKLRDVDRQRTEIWREAAHDLRGNVGLVTATASILTEDSLPDGLRAKAFALLQANVTSLTNLLEDLLGLARLEAGRENLHLQTFDAADLLRNLCSTLELSAAEKGLYLRAEGPSSLVVEGDPAKTQRILQNLTLNALKYTESGGILVSWKPTQEKDVERWAIRIQDTGPGYEPGGPLSEELQKATGSSLKTEKRGGSSNVEPVPSLPGFSLSPQGAPKQRPGEGIGLLIVKRLCELLQASMEIVSAPGEGTVFQIVLPRSYARPPL
jgi:signal transduction histidine kinase